MPRQKNWTDADLIQAVKNNISMRQTLLALGLCGRGGGSYKNARKRINELNLDTSHWLGCGHLKGKSHDWGYKKKRPDSEVFCEDSDYNIGHNIKRRLRNDHGFPDECFICGISEWQGQKLSLQLDHINGKSDDNRIENLRFLCPNCHSLTETFAGKNKIGL